MSRDDNVLTELLEAFGISGNLFILWDENGTLITCDQKTHTFLESNGTKSFENFNIDIFLKTLLENKIFSEYNIGHWVVSESMFSGLGSVVKDLKNLMEFEN